MAAGSAAWQSLVGLIDDAIEALIGPRRRVAIAVALGVYAALWTAYRVISTLPRDIHFDMSELYAWSQTLAFGYDKHPPLSAFVVRAWFTVFPVSGWSFTLLAVLNVVLTLYVVWLILERWTDPAKSAFGVALLTLVPFYNFQALKYNANTVLLPVWALAAYAFMRAFETRSAPWSVVAGIAAGAAMLGKYWSVFLAGGFVVAALVDPRRRAFFLSPAPYLMVVVGGAVIAPHIAWLATVGGGPMDYVNWRLVSGPPPSLAPFLRYSAGIVGYAALSVAVWALLLRPSRRALRDTVDPADPQRTLAFLCLMLPNILPLVAAPWLGEQFTSLWALPGYSLLPLVLLASPRIVMSWQALRWAVALPAALGIAALVAAPLVALGTHTRSNPRPNDYASLLARDIAARWIRIAREPLPEIYTCTKSVDAAHAAAFNLQLPTSSLFGRRGLGARADLLDQGGVIVAVADDADCRDHGDAILEMRPRGQRYEATYQPTLFGYVGKPFSYVAYFVPPR